MALPSSAYGIAPFTNPDSDLTDYVGFVDLSLLPQAWWDEVTSSDGARGRVGKDFDETELASHWRNFDDVAQTGQVFFKWSGTLASTGTQEVRIYPPQSGNTSYLPTDTFGSEAVYTNDSARFPFDNDPLGSSPQLTNVTGNGADGVSEGSMTSGDLVTGKLGSAWDFDGDNDAVVSPESSIFDLSDAENFAWRGWINPTDLSGNSFQYFLSWGTVASANSINVWMDENSRSGARTKININGTDYDQVPGDRPPENQFTKFIIFYDQSSVIVKFGDTTIYSASANSIAVSEAGDFFLACRSDRDAIRRITGMLDEWILSKGSNITEDYLSLEYANENDPATFWGTWTVEGGGGQLTASYSAATSRIVTSLAQAQPATNRIVTSLGEYSGATNRQVHSLAGHSGATDRKVTKQATASPATNRKVTSLASFTGATLRTVKHLATYSAATLREVITQAIASYSAATNRKVTKQDSYSAATNRKVTTQATYQGSTVRIVKKLAGYAAATLRKITKQDTYSASTNRKLTTGAAVSGATNRKVTRLAQFSGATLRVVKKIAGYAAATLRKVINADSLPDFSEPIPDERIINLNKEHRFTDLSARNNFIYVPAHRRYITLKDGNYE